MLLSRRRVTKRGRPPGISTNFLIPAISVALIRLCFDDDKDEMRSLQGSFCLFAAAAVLLAQAMNVVRVDATGNERVKTEEIVRVSGLKIGSEVTKEQIHAAAERLMGSGKFERVDYRWKPEESGVVVTFAVREKADAPEPAEAAASKPRIRKVTFEGAAVIPAARLEATLAGVADDRPYDSADFQQTLDNLLRPLYQDRGHWDPRFKQRTEPAEGGVRVVVNVDEGEAMKLASVTIQGGEQKWVQTAGFPMGQVATAKAVQAAMGKVRQAMEREGYLKGLLVAREELEGNELRLVLRATPGTKFVFRVLILEGLDREAEVRARKLWKLKSGETMNPELVETFVREIFTARIPRGTGVEREIRFARGTADAEVVLRFR